MFLPFRVITLLLIPYSLFDFYSRLSHTFVVDYRVHYKCDGVMNVVETFDNDSYSIFVSKCWRFSEPAFES